MARPTGTGKYGLVPTSVYRLPSNVDWDSLQCLLLDLDNYRCLIPDFYQTNPHCSKSLLELQEFLDELARVRL